MIKNTNSSQAACVKSDSHGLQMNVTSHSAFTAPLATIGLRYVPPRDLFLKTSEVQPCRYKNKIKGTKNGDFIVLYNFPEVYFI